MKNLCIAVCVFAIALFFVQCQESTNTKVPAAPKKHQPRKIQRNKPADFTYSFVKAKEWLKTADSGQVRIACAVNRTDKQNLSSMDSILVPNNLDGDVEFYMPYPLDVPSLKDIRKIIFFSYPAQSFGAYEDGQLIYAGPTNMGRKKDPTPTGLYFTNWKAEQTTSTFNDEWDLKWNFNIENKEGIGFHQYALPGYPASHSCLRLQEKDAKYLYEWADQWELKGTDSVVAKGTPVVVFGAYDFDGPKPWLQLAANPHALDISVDFLQQLVAPHTQEIMEAQEKRAQLGLDNDTQQ